MATLDQLADGRIVLGLGGGWAKQEYDVYGIPFPSTGERFERLEEQLAIISGLWETPVGKTFDYEGRHYHVSGSPALPKPVQPGGPPIIIGGYGAKRTPRLAATYAKEFNLPFPPLDYYGTAIDQVRAACEKYGRDPASLQYTVAQVVCVGSDDAEFRRRAAAIGREPDELRENGCAGSPDEVVGRLRAFAAAGAEAAYLQVLDLDDLDHLRLIASEVMPEVASA